MRKSRLSWCKQTRLIKLFVAGFTTRTAASVVAVNRTTASYYFHSLRLLIYKNSQEPCLLEDDIEVNESYFGGRRKGKRGRVTANKVPVFGLLKHNGNIYTCIIPYAKADTLIPIYYKRELSESSKATYAQYNDIAKEHFHMFSKECEWRFNYSDPKRQLHSLRHQAIMTA